jgi:ribonuclease D
MAALRDPGLYRVDPERAWMRLKLRGVRTGDVGPLIALAEWREREAQDKDVPRGRVLKDEAIFELARVKPATVEELGRARTIPQGFERSRTAQQILEAIAKGRKIPRDQLPEIEREDRRAVAPPDVVELLKVLLKRQSEKYGVAARLIATSDDLELIALGRSDTPALEGWRRQVFGDVAVKMLEGRIALTLNQGAIELIEPEGINGI